MANMARREASGDYQIGIYNVRRIGRRKWEVRAVGRGTIGDGFVGVFPTLGAAHLQCTGERISD